MYVCLLVEFNFIYDSHFSLGVQVKLREMKPGTLSHELKEALGMPEGSPPPWLINMQVRLANILCLILTFTVSLELFWTLHSLFFLFSQKKKKKTVNFSRDMALHPLTLIWKFLDSMLLFHLEQALVIMPVAGASLLLMK